jgi:phage repressor protein C with HTH and peptisase S24 domain
MKLNLLSERLKWCMDKKSAVAGYKISQSDVAKAAGVSRATVNHWLSDTNGISLEKSLLLSGYFGVNYRWIFSGDGIPKMTLDDLHHDTPRSRREIEISENAEYLTIKRVDLKLSAGITGYSVEYLNGDLAPIVFRKDWVSSKGYDIDKLFALKVSGHSMETSLYDDDLVVINAADSKLIDGEVYAVNYEGELVIKRMIRQADGWYLSSDNPDKRKYADKLCHENCIVIGRVIYKQSERI